VQALDLDEKLGGIVGAAAFQLRFALLVDRLGIEFLDRCGSLARCEKAPTAPLAAATGREKTDQRGHPAAP
jgi:hypothetical protein